MRKKRQKKLVKIILIGLVTLLILLILIDLKVWKFFEKKDIKIISLEDKCSLMSGVILHAIKDDSGCENYCHSECSIIKMKFYKVEFQAKDNSCNTCNCYCK